MLQVSVRHSDNYVYCSCNFFFQKGYLCRHAFAALYQCRVKEIPRAFVKTRWTKDAIKHHSFLAQADVSLVSDSHKRMKLKRTRAWFEFKDSMNLVGEDEGSIDIVLNGLYSINSTLIGKNGRHLDGENCHRADKFIGPIPDSDVTVFNPDISRNKGCGSRIKSSREISQGSEKKRKCSNCNRVVGHNARTCPEPKKSSVSENIE